MNRKVIQDFLNNELGQKLDAKDTYVYNEFSLQHELGIYLRDELKKINVDYRVQFERNINKLQHKKVSNVKKEMDIYIYNINNAQERYAIELKFPRNKQYPEQMYSFVKDIRFMEDVKHNAGAKKTFVITLVDDPNFYAPNSTIGGIYNYFRGNNCKGKNIIKKNQRIYKPTGKRKNIDYVEVNNDYQIQWNQVLYNGKPLKDYRIYQKLFFRF